MNEPGIDELSNIDRSEIECRSTSKPCRFDEFTDH